VGKCASEQVESKSEGAGGGCWVLGDGNIVGTRQRLVQNIPNADYVRHDSSILRKGNS